MTAPCQHLLQGFGLWRRAWKSIEDDAFVVCPEAVIDIGQNAHHQLVGYQLTIVDISFGGLAQFRSILDFASQHVTCRDMAQAILLYHLVTLRAFAGTRSSENHNILHCMFYI